MYYIFDVSVILPSPETPKKAVCVVDKPHPQQSRNILSTISTKHKLN